MGRVELPDFVWPPELLSTQADWPVSGLTQVWTCTECGVAFVGSRYWRPKHCWRCFAARARANIRARWLARHGG